MEVENCYVWKVTTIAGSIFKLPYLVDQYFKTLGLASQHAFETFESSPTNDSTHILMESYAFFFLNYLQIPDLCIMEELS